MSANSVKIETDLSEAAIAWLKARLPQGWQLESATAEGGETRLVLRGGNAGAAILVQPRQSLTPREASYLLQGFAKALRSISGGTALLVVSPWLSPRTRAVLTEQGINYVDLTGNALVRIDNPAVYLETVGADRNPAPKARGKAQLRGARAARLIRLLADVRPPYGVRELARAAKLAPGYTSQLLETLYDEALVERSRRGRVESVNVGDLLRRWSSTYDVLATNAPESFVAADGIDTLLPKIAAELEAGRRIAITGSFAAARLAPVAAPALLLAYSEQPTLLAQDLGLLRAEEGANVILLRPFDEVVWRRNSPVEGLRYVSPSQTAVDCLTGTGRMPAEGEALLEWMRENESEWRSDSLTDPD